jgi:hypothetical protein
MVNHAQNAAQLGYTIGVHLAETGQITIIEPTKNFLYTTGPDYSRVLFNNEFYYMSHHSSDLISEWHGGTPTHAMEQHCAFTKEARTAALESYFTEEAGG